MSEEKGKGGEYRTVRHPEVLGSFIGRKLEDVSQTDWAEVQQGEPAVVILMFEGGNSIHIPMKEGIGIHYFGSLIKTKKARKRRARKEKE